MVGETHVRGSYSRKAVHGTPRAAQKATSFHDYFSCTTVPADPLGDSLDAGTVFGFIFGQIEPPPACWCRSLWIRKPGCCSSSTRHLLCLQALLTEGTGLQRLCLDFPDIAVGLGGFIAAVSGISIV